MRSVRCRLSMVCDGEEANQLSLPQSEFAQTPTPDLNLLDMQLPRKEGHTLQLPSNLNDRGAPQR